MQVDRHVYTKRFFSAEKSVENSSLSNTNKRIITEFEYYLFATGISKPREKVYHPPSFWVEI